MLSDISGRISTPSDHLEGSDGHQRQYYRASNNVYGINELFKQNHWNDNNEASQELREKKVNTGVSMSRGVELVLSSQQIP